MSIRGYSSPMNPHLDNVAVNWGQVLGQVLVLGTRSPTCGNSPKLADLSLV